MANKTGWSAVRAMSGTCLAARVTGGDGGGRTRITHAPLQIEYNYICEGKDEAKQPKLTSAMP
jgi:hypothetical protein